MRAAALFGALRDFVEQHPKDPLAGNAQARFDSLKMNWLGSIGKLQNVCATWHTSTVKTIKAAQERETIVAGAGATSNSALMPRIINELIGTRFKVIAGYDPTSGLNLALERGEAEGICGLSWSTIKASRPHWIKDRLLNVIVQVGVEKLPDLPDVPGALDLVRDPAKRQVLELILIRQEIGRPIVLPPGVPADRVAALRRAAALTRGQRGPLAGLLIIAFLAMLPAATLVNMVIFGPAATPARAEVVMGTMTLTHPGLWIYALFELLGTSLIACIPPVVYWRLITTK